MLVDQKLIGKKSNMDQVKASDHGWYADEYTRKLSEEYPVPQIDYNAKRDLIKSHFGDPRNEIHNAIIEHFVKESQIRGAWVGYTFGKGGFTENPIAQVEAVLSQAPSTRNAKNAAIHSLITNGHALCANTETREKFKNHVVLIPTETFVKSLLDVVK